MSIRSRTTDETICDVCGREVDSWSDGKIDVCSDCVNKPHEHIHGPYVDEDQCARCQARMIEPDELDRRAVWLRALHDDLAAADSEPEQWQIELAARILARPYHWTVTGHGDIWVFAHTTATELGDDMKADGRLNEYGNWPDNERRP